MIERNRCKHRCERPFDHVGGIEPAAEPHFKQQEIGRMTREQDESGCGLDFKDSDRRTGVGRFTLDQDSTELLIRNKYPAACPAQSIALIQTNEMRGSIDMHALPGGLKN